MCDRTYVDGADTHTPWVAGAVGAEQWRVAP